MRCRDRWGWGHTLLSVCVGLHFAGGSLAADCEACRQYGSELQQRDEEKQKTIELLGKNKAYLAALSADEASRTLKVKSNIVVILKKLDAIKAKSEKTREKMRELGCESCSDSPMSSEENKSS